MFSEKLQAGTLQLCQGFDTQELIVFFWRLWTWTFLLRRGRRRSLDSVLTLHIPMRFVQFKHTQSGLAQIGPVFALTDASPVPWPVFGKVILRIFSFCLNVGCAMTCQAASARARAWHRGRKPRVLEAKMIFTLNVWPHPCHSWLARPVDEAPQSIPVTLAPILLPLGLAFPVHSACYDLNLQADFGRFEAKSSAPSRVARLFLAASP